MNKEKRWKRRWLLVVGLFVAVALLFVLFRYQPIFRAAPGYELQNITDPGWLNGRLKTIYAIIEQTPCEYALLGWQNEEQLYYTAQCNGKEQVWRYDVQREQTDPITAVPPDLHTETILKTAVVDALLANIRPRELETVSREVFMVDAPLPSPNGRFIALVSRHIYGPQDILLLSDSLTVIR